MTATVYTQAEADQKISDLEQRLEALEAGTAPPIDPVDPPDPPDPGVSQLIYGYSKTNRSRLEKDTGVLVAAERSFADKCATSWAASELASLPTRYFPFHSFKPGQGYSWGNPNLNAFRSFIASVPRPMVIIPSHEPENDGNNPATFVAMIDKYAEVVADVANPHVHLAINLMTSWANKTASQGGSVAYIPDPSALACPLGLTWDGYRPAGKDGQSPEQVYAAPRDLTEDSGHAWWGIMETASENDAASWVGDVAAWVDEEGGKASLYWPSQVSDPGAVDWYPPSSAFDEFAAVALKYGGTPISSRYGT
jgi:hypothetical protein